MNNSKKAFGKGCLRLKKRLLGSKTKNMIPFIKENVEPSEFHLFPHIGQRIVKTTIAVYLCFLVCYFRDLFGQDMSAEAAITAIICMQPYVKDTKDYAINRFTGTLIGSAWGLIFLFLLATFPVLGINRFILYALMSTGVLLSLYSSVLFRQPDTSSLSAIVFICIVISFPDIEEPLVQAGNRFLDVLVGTGIAIIVNVFRFPRVKNRNYVYFLRTKDLVPDRFSQIAPSALFRLNYLYNDGAKICLISEHAPAFFVSQMSMVKVNTPLIVMDGAAIYDTNENQYLYAQTLPKAVSSSLRRRLDDLGVSYFIYTIHNSKTCIFHHGETTKPETEMLEIMKRSPYRSYLEGEIYDPGEIIYIKVISTKTTLEKILEDLYFNDQPLFFALRPVVRPHKEAPECKALYLYSGRSSVQLAQAFLMDQLKEKTADLALQEIRLRSPYHSERDALHLLHKVEKSYEPIKCPWKGRRP